MSFAVTILGCGFSGGVPRPGSGWGHCDPTNPKNRRRRCSIVVDRTTTDGRQTRVLVDTGPDLRGLFLANRRRVDVYADEATWRTLSLRFAYCFVTPPGSNYPAILNRHPLVDLRP